MSGVFLSAHSAYAITISGTLYSDEGTTAVTGGGKVLILRVGTSTPGFFSTTTIAGTGFFQFTGVTTGIDAGIPITLYVDGDASFRATTFTKASSSVNDITNLDLYQSYVIISHEGTSGTSTTITDLSFYDSDDDGDIQYTAATSTNSLRVNALTELYIKAGKTFQPGGAITVHGSGSASSTDGTLHLASGSAYIAGGFTTLGGSVTASGTAAYYDNGHPLTFTASTTGKYFTVATTTDVGHLVFNGVGGAWTIGTSSTSTNFAIMNGTVTTPNDGLVVDGGFTNYGTYINPGTTTMKGITDEVRAYVAGRDATGDSTGVGSIPINSIAISGNYLYAGKDGDATACSQTAGSAIGCELMVFDISSTTNPLYVAGRDSSGDSTGVGDFISILSLAISGNYLYVGKSSDGTACSQTAGSAIGCELMVFDIASTTNPIYVAGRDSSGDSTGVGSVAIRSLTISGNSLYVGKNGDATACSQVAGSATGCELMVFDIASTTNPLYVAGRDSSGDSTGVGSLAIYSLAISGNSLYVGKNGNTTACSQTAGSAIGCEIMVFDIASSTNPLYVAGRDASGDSTGVGSALIYSLAISGNSLYVGKSANITACSQTAGSAIGCELMDFDIASTTNPVYVAGRDAGGDSTGVGSLAIFSLAISGNSLYVGKNGNTTACSQTAGSAIGCEIMVFDIASNYSGTMTGTSAFNDVVVSGRAQLDANASTSGFTINSGASLTAPPLLSIIGNYSNSGTFTANSGTTTFNGTGAQTITGIATGTSAFANLSFNGAGTKTFSANASTTGHFLIQSGSGAVTAPPLLSLNGNYSNSGTFTANGGTTTLSGTGPGRQTLLGTMIGSSAFHHLHITNSTASTTFTSSASTTGNFFANIPNAKIEFAIGVTTTLQNLIILGTLGNEINIFSGTAGSRANLHVPGLRSISYAKVKDSDACSTDSPIDATNGTNIDRGNNLCWFFIPPTINLLHYRFRIDHESEVSAGYYTTEDTALSNRLYLGDRVRLRTTLSNSGAAPATLYNYRLEYASSSCTTWSDLGTNQEWFPDYTQYVFQYSSTTDSSGLSNPGGYTWQSGVFRAGSATTGTYTLPANYFTEHEFTINSTVFATKGTTYCFRITNNGSITNFVYTTQPQLMLRGDAHPSSGGSSSEASGVGPAIGGGGQGGGGAGEGSGSGGSQGGGGQGGGGGDSG